MDASLTALFNLYTFSTGRRMFALQQTQKAARTLHFGALVEHIDQALAHDRETRTLEARWAGRASPNAGNPEAAALHVRIDRVLTALRDHAMSHAAGSELSDPVNAVVDNLLHEIFPAGIFAVTALSSVEQLAAVDGIVDKLTHGPLAHDARDLTLTPIVQRLKDLAAKYRTALEKSPASLEFDTVRTARAQGQEFLLQTVSIVLGKYYGSDTASAGNRAKLLAPILKQNDEIQASLRAHRPVTDVNPDTGAADPSAPTTPNAAGNTAPGPHTAG